jgi:hypothetical protein
MTKVDTNFFGDNFNNYQVVSRDENYYNSNMVLIGIFMIVEMIIFLLIAFMYFLIQSAMTAERYSPEVGHKPFSPSGYITRKEANYKEWELTY